jgi:hypothetical protein
MSVKRISNTKGESDIKICRINTWRGGFFWLLKCTSEKENEKNKNFFFA